MSTHKLVTEIPPPTKSNVEASVSVLSSAEDGDNGTTIRQKSIQIPDVVKRWAVRGFAICLAIASWHYLTETDFNRVLNFENVPEPWKVAVNFIHHAQTMDFYLHILVSMKRILIGYVAATVLGIIVGLLMGRFRTAEDICIPYIEVLRPIPAVAWIPLAILIWPTEESSIIFITFLGAFFPIVLNTVQGVEATPEILVRAARSLGATNVEIFWHVVFPAALPSIASGLAIGMGVSWFSLLAGEIISGQYGIGYFTWNAYSLIKYTDIVVGMLIIGGLGTFSTYLIRLLTRPMMRWQALEAGR
ncbi:MAG: ABC transporter permease [Rhodospirillaceae bacterium]|nr:ABC transporter permease [Rhodospirillaceae bacterium]